MEEGLVLDPYAARDFAIALLIGALIGIERERKKAVEHSREIGGIRTFVLFSQIGALSAWLSRQLASAWPVTVAIFGVTLVIALAHAAQVGTQREREDPDVGLTTEAAAIVTTLLGAVALLGFPQIAGALGIATAVLLAFKRPIHGFVGRLDEQDVYAGLKLLVASFIILPLLPNRPLDPWGALNPYGLWLLVVLISALSLLGYVAVRILGTGRGTALTGLFGGLASSTAVTLSFARRSRELDDPPHLDALGAGILLAWAMMFGRVMVEVAVVHPALLPRVAAPQVAMLCLAAATAFVFYRRSHGVDETTTDVLLRNPFSLTAAIKFAAVFAVVMLAVSLVQRYAPGSGEIAVAALAGLSDVDAITLSMATLARRGGDPTLAARAITVATFSNTLTKCVLVLALSAVGFKWRIAIATGAVVAGGAVALLFV
ncbi:MAG: MgtC/SapB family protein [Thermodesulfobacteriota bacterium]